MSADDLGYGRSSPQLGRTMRDVLSFQKRPDWRNPAPLGAGIAAAGAAAAVIRRCGKG